MSSIVDGRKVDLVIGIPHSDRGVRDESANKSLAAMISYTRKEGVEIAILESYGANLGGNRNKCVEAAKDIKAPWLLFIDDDMCVPEDGAIKLMKHNEKVVSGLAVTRKPPCEPCAYLANDYGFYDSIMEWKEAGLTRVDAFGMAFTLIKMSVFDKIEKPYYSFAPYKDTSIGEDMYFCQKVQKVNIPLWLDANVVVGHMGSYMYTIDDYLRLKEEKAEPESISESSGVGSRDKSDKSIIV